MRHVMVGPEDACLRWVEFPGTDPVRVYLHGLGASCATYFATAAAHPALATHRSLMLDFLGFGISDRPRSFGYALEDHADSVARVLDALHVSAADIVGHSMGGAVAIILARRRPDLVSHLVLAEPNLDPSRRERIEEYTEDQFVAGGFDRSLVAISAEWAATMRLADPVAVYRSERGLGDGFDPMMRDILAGLTMPRTLLVGELSDDVGGLARLRACGVVVLAVPGAGHQMMLDNPEEFALITARALTGG